MITCLVVVVVVEQAGNGLGTAARVCDSEGIVCTGSGATDAKQFWGA